MTTDDILDGATLTRADLANKRFTNSCRVTEETPWDLLRCLLLRYIWCQRCNKVMKNTNFHLGTAIHSSWQTLIQIGTTSWQNIWEDPRDGPQQGGNI